MSENPINKCGFHNRKMMSESRIFLNRTTIDDRQRVVYVWRYHLLDD